MSDKQVIKTTCPRDCYDSCGIAVIKRDGRVRKVLGDPEHPVARGALCGKCALAYNGVWRDEAARLSQPLCRSGPKGSGRFEPLSWEDALARIAERLKGLEQAGRQDKLIHAHYTGTCSLLAGSFPMRFFNYFGAREVDPDSVCNKAGHEALAMLYGSSTTGASQDRGHRPGAPRNGRGGRSLSSALSGKRRGAGLRVAAFGL
jgi:anaerobic selenocysteine-containing dehydrogenase